MAEVAEAPSRETAPAGKQAGLPIRVAGLLTLATSAVLLGWLLNRWLVRQHGTSPELPTAPTDVSPRLDQLVTEASEESFPASDAPSFNP